MPQYTAAEKADYYKKNPDKLKAKLEREAKGDVGGVIRILSISAPLEYIWQTTSFNLSAVFTGELVTMCSVNHRSIEKSAHEIAASGIDIVLTPATMSSYNSYAACDTTATGQGCQNQFNDTLGDVAMNSLIILFEPSSTINTYSLTVGLKKITR
jgi:hypothetical protein